MLSIQEQDFDPGTEQQALESIGPGIGAVCAFTGLVRERGDQDDVTGLQLEHYPGMTEASIEELVGQASRRWAIQGWRIIHRVGTLPLGSRIVFVGIASAHRADAFAACEFLMDALKTTAPFWKKELTEDGGHWVEQKTSDTERTRQWFAGAQDEEE